MEIIRRGTSIIINPPVHSRTIVWLHGLGDSANGFSGLFKEIPLLKDCRHVLLTAPVRAVTLNSGMRMTSWYDITEMGNNSINEEVRESAEIVSQVLDEEGKETDCLMLGGFSQGAVLSLYTGLFHYKSPLAALVCFSGYLLDFEPTRSNVPIFISHGTLDDLIPIDWAFRTYEKLEATYRREEGVGHSISIEGVLAGRSWLESVLLNST